MIDIAIGMLDYLDPILGYDLEFIKTLPADEATRNIAALRIVVRCRAAVHPDGSVLNDAWNVVMEALEAILDGAPV